MTDRKTIFIADTHVHFYPCYDLGYALDTAHMNFDFLLQQIYPSKINQKVNLIKILCLTERSDCSFFENLSKHPSTVFNNARTYKIESENYPEFIKITDSVKGDIVLIPGRQIVSAEKIEILALACNQTIPDQQPLLETLNQIKNHQGLPVLSWAPGKWFFKRGKIIENLIDTGHCKNLILADTSLRPPIWPEPILFRKAKSQNMITIAGSDPLPFDGEEKHLARYAITWESNLNFDSPTASLKAVLIERQTPFKIVGTRSSSLNVFQRVLKNYLASRQATLC